ncbi:MAG: polysaccharide pyruvyl transferase family protein [Parachlamydiaceae bacterium]
MHNFLIALLLWLCLISSVDGGLYWWRPPSGTNFGDELSHAIVERMTGRSVERSSLDNSSPTLFAIGSILHFSKNGDVIWGSGFRGKPPLVAELTDLDVRAVRGPCTRLVLLEKGIPCPEVYEDPAMLFPLLFPEFQPQEATQDYIVIPHINEMQKYRKVKHVVYPSEPWQEIVKKILKSRLVVSGSLHGLIIAEAYGIPARYLRTNKNEPLFKYRDYYEATGRPQFTFASSIEEALLWGGEPPRSIDLQPLLDAFPWDYFDSLP